MLIHDGRILNPHATFVWNEVWAHNVYAELNERQRRAHQRATIFRIYKFTRKDDSVLDIACGSGDFLSAVSNLIGTGGLLVGLDRSPAALDLARTRNECNGLQLICGEATSLPLAASSVNIVVLFGIVEHIKDTERLFLEVDRVLRPGGRIFISTSNALSTLQIKNRLLAGLGRYAYGYQKNWLLQPFLAAVGRTFIVEDSFIGQAANDMPFVRLIDHLVNQCNSSWGRYICVRATSERVGVSGETRTCRRS